MYSINQVRSFWILALVAMSLFGSRASAAPLVMTIDQSASSLTFSGQLGSVALLPQAPGSTTTSYTGTITIDANNLASPSSISILSAVADADLNVSNGTGLWLPKLGGQTGTTDANPLPPAPADYAVRAQLQGNDIAFGAARGVVFDITSGPEAVGAGGLFTSSETLTVLSGLFDTWVHPAIPVIGGMGGQDDTTGDIYPRDLTMPTLSSYVVSGGVATLTIPIRGRNIDGADFTAFTGTLVATAVIPEPASILLLGTAVTAVLTTRRKR